MRRRRSWMGWAVDELEGALARAIMYRPHLRARYAVRDMRSPEVPTASPYYGIFPLTGGIGANGAATWSTATPEEIIADLRAMADATFRAGYEVQR